VKANIKFFILLRNKIEHRFAPAIDLRILGECQAFLFNFEGLITSRFSDYYSLNSSIAIPLRAVQCQQHWEVDAQKKLLSRHFQELKDFVAEYNRSLPEAILADQNYVYKIYLIPMTGNHRRSSDLAVQCISNDETNPELAEALDRAIILTKKERVHVANPGTLRPKAVCEQVAKSLGIKFSPTYHHPKVCMHYQVKAHPEWSQYDEAHHDTIYTQAWVDFLTKKLAKQTEWDKIFQKKTSGRE